MLGVEAVGPALSLIAIALGAFSIRDAWRGARRTALRPALIWTGAALATAGSSQIWAILETDPGKPTSGVLTYLSALAVLSGMVTVLNARKPGEGAWGILTALLFLVFLIPWLEGSGMARADAAFDRLRLRSPWTIFYGLLLIAGVTNYLPTRHALAACWVAAGLIAEYLVTSEAEPFLSRPTLSTIASGCWGLAAISASRSARGGDRAASEATVEAESELDRLWLWFRDRWGVVWALRVMERFNRTCEVSAWPIRMTWRGAVHSESSAIEAGRPPEIPVGAAETLASLLRRFAEPERLIEAMRSPQGGLAEPRASGDHR